MHFSCVSGSAIPHQHACPGQVVRPFEDRQSQRPATRGNGERSDSPNRFSFYPHWVPDLYFGGQLYPDQLTRHLIVGDLPGDYLLAGIAPFGARDCPIQVGFERGIVPVKFTLDSWLGRSPPAILQRSSCRVPLLLLGLAVPSSPRPLQLEPPRLHQRQIGLTGRKARTGAPSIDAAETSEVPGAGSSPVSLSTRIIPGPSKVIRR